MENTAFYLFPCVKHKFHWPDFHKTQNFSSE